MRWLSIGGVGFGNLDGGEPVHLVRQVGSRRVTSSILQYNQAAIISETMGVVGLLLGIGEANSIGEYCKNWR